MQSAKVIVIYYIIANRIISHLRVKTSLKTKSKSSERTTKKLNYLQKIEKNNMFIVSNVSFVNGHGNKVCWSHSQGQRLHEWQRVSLSNVTVSECQSD